MIDEKLYLTDGSLFATKYNRVVHGGRGDYIELEKDHIVPELVSKFGNDLNGIYDFYYLSVYIGWLLSGSSFFLIQWESHKEFQFLPLFAPAGKCFFIKREPRKASRFCLFNF